jgi:hypothetical protein
MGLPVRPAPEQNDTGTEPVPELVAEIPEGFDIGGLHDGRQDNLRILTGDSIYAII